MSQELPPNSVAPPPPPRRYRQAVGPRLTKVLAAVFGLFALLSINSVYLAGVTILESATGRTYQNWFYMNMFLVHLILGLLLVVPTVVFGFVHMSNTYDRRNRRAVKVGYALFATALALLASGIVLTRLEGVIVIKDPAVRSVAYWAHVITPFLAAWLFVLHRLAGKKIRWEVGRRIGGVAVAFGVVMLVWQTQDPRRWNVAGPASGEKYFFPSLARTATGNFIPERVLNDDAYCKECHADTHASWSSSAHRFSSFNNPLYLFSVRETRKVAFERDKDMQASRFCAGCHDPVVFFSGKFDDPKFDDVNDPAGQAGITCTACHAITNLNSPRGNSDFTIEEPVHYPFTFSEAPSLRWVSRQLVKAKPEFHTKTFLKPLHKTAEFCGACHKVHLPEQLNKYKWLRGQNHYDSFLLSGVSGHFVASFYYPAKAEPNCSTCHMKPQPSTQFAARSLDDSGELKIHDHMFPSANTALPHLLKLDPKVNQKHRDFNAGVMRVDIFGVKEDGRIDGGLVAPLRPNVPVLVPGKTYLLETVIRTLKMGHLFTEGTADSNEAWLDIRVTTKNPDGSERVIGRSGGLGSGNQVDPWSHFVNNYVLDRNGNRIDRRNAQDIFVALYNHQIPPGAADSIHYQLIVPKDVKTPVTVEARLQYRKFDTTYMKFVYGKDSVNELPIMTLASDVVVFPVTPGASVENGPPPTPEWQRWNDYGIGLLRKGGKTKGELRQAEQAFSQVEALGRPDGPLNLARVYFLQGTVQDQAIAALKRAAAFNPPAPPWTVAWFTGQVNKQNGYLDEAIASFRSILAADNTETRGRGFDFSKAYLLINELAQTLFERAKQERGESGKTLRTQLLQEARAQFERVLELDPENATAHFNLDLLYRQLGDKDKAQAHAALYQKYRVDDNARDHAVTVARTNDPAANHAAEAIVIYDLNRREAFETGPGPRAAAPLELIVPVPPAAKPPAEAKAPAGGVR